MGAVLRMMVVWIGPFFRVLAGSNRIWFFGLGLAALGVLLHNTLVTLVNQLLGVVLAKMSGVGAGTASTSFAVTVTGVTAWLAVHLRMPDCLTWMMWCLGTRITIKLIPFIRL